MHQVKPVIGEQVACSWHGSWHERLSPNSRHAPSQARSRTRGSIEELSSGSLRVRVYAGTDPISKRPHYLKETVPAGPKAAAEAEKVLTRFLNEIDERRQPRTTATVRQLIDRHLDALTQSGKVTPEWVRTCRTLADHHIYPFIGDHQAGRVDAFILESLYAELARCQDHCDQRRRRTLQHRTPREHRCDEHDGAVCGAFRRAVRWKWIAVSPVAEAEKPDPPPPQPRPPLAKDAARIVNAAWSDGHGRSDPDFGTFIWVTMTAGPRRGELCALARNDFEAVRVCLDCGHEHDNRDQQCCAACQSTTLSLASRSSLSSAFTCPRPAAPVI